MFGVQLGWTSKSPDCLQGVPVESENNRDQMLINVFCTAIEGGINYWAEVLEYHWCDKDGSEDLKGFYARIVIREDDEESEPAKEYCIDASTIEAGIDRLIHGTVTWDGQAMRGTHLYKLACGLNGPLCEEVDYDADDADNIVQAGLFNDIVYG